MALKGKKLHPDDIQGIRGFTIAYKGLATAVMVYKELAFNEKSSIIPSVSLQDLPTGVHVLFFHMNLSS
jgi:hypothetical protein